MRLAVALLAVALSGSAALADQAKPADPPATAGSATAAPATDAKPKIGLRVVRVMPESQQALLFDKNRGTHVLVDEGGEIDGYKVTEIADDAVTLEKDGSEVVLAAPYRRAQRGDSPDAPVVKKPKAGGPEDPYADAPADAKPGAASSKAPQDPYAEPVRTVEAPKTVKPGDDGVRVAEAPDATPKAPADATPPATTTPPPATTTPPATTPPATPPPATTAVATGDLVLTRAAFRAELSDFNKLATGVKATFIPAGVRLDAVTAGSLFARAGLKANDTVIAVNGQAVKSIDDAAELYAHAGSAKVISIDVQRAGKSMSLHVTIQ